MNEIKNLKKKMIQELKELAMRNYRKNIRKLNREELTDILENIYLDNRSFWNNEWGDYDSFFVSIFKEEVIRTGATLDNNMVLVKVGERFYQFKKRPKHVTLYGSKKLKTDKKMWELLGDIELSEQNTNDLGPPQDILGGGDILRKKKRKKE
jgi:catalase (peroxidase I)